MADSLAAIVLSAGAGTRLRPLTWYRPKALCPVGNRLLVDIAVARARTVAHDVAVNVHAGRALMERHLAGRVHLSHEEPEALGTAGALGLLREWVDGRPVVVLNVDAWHLADLRPLVADWDGERIRVLVAGDAAAGLQPGAGVCAALMPWAAVRSLRPEPSGLYAMSWRPSAEAGRLDAVGYDGPFVDCGTPWDYLRANMLASEGAPVVGAGAVVEGELERAVVWPGGVVRAGERLVDAVRIGDRVTVLCR